MSFTQGTFFLVCSSGKMFVAFFYSRPGDWEPKRGNVLGEWDNQLEEGESHIVSFMSLGPKTYAYETNKGRVEMKIKSITQNGFTENILEWDEQR